MRPIDAKDRSFGRDRHRAWLTKAVRRRFNVYPHDSEVPNIAHGLGIVNSVGRDPPARSRADANCGRPSWTDRFRCAIIFPMLRWTGWGWQVVAWVIVGADDWTERQFGLVPGLVALIVCVIAAHLAYRASR